MHADVSDLIVWFVLVCRNSQSLKVSIRSLLELHICHNRISTSTFAAPAPYLLICNTTEIDHQIFLDSLSNLCKCSSLSENYNVIPTVRNAIPLLNVFFFYCKTDTFIFNITKG